ncbi:MAG: hypothetical protein ACRCTJ_06670 [Brevinema sp.]
MKIFVSFLVLLLPTCNMIKDMAIDDMQPYEKIELVYISTNHQMFWTLDSSIPFKSIKATLTSPIQLTVNIIDDQYFSKVGETTNIILTFDFDETELQYINDKYNYLINNVNMYIRSEDKVIPTRFLFFFYKRKF